MGRDKFYEKLGLAGTPTLDEIRYTQVQFIEAQKSTSKPLESKETKVKETRACMANCEVCRGLPKKIATGEKVEQAVVEVMAPTPPANPEEKAMLEERIKELEQWKAARLAKEEATRLKKAEAGKCPRCGKAVSWDSLPPKQMPEPWLLDFLFESPAVRVKECPLCGYAE